MSEIERPIFDYLNRYIYILIHNLVQKTTRAPIYLSYIGHNGSINKFILAAKPVILLSGNLALSSHGYLSRSNTIIHVHFRVQTQNLMYREASALIHIFNNLTNRIWFVFFFLKKTQCLSDIVRIQVSADTQYDHILYS